MEKKLKKIVSQVLNLDSKHINDDLLRDDCEEWDSFNHLLLISEIEKDLGIRFNLLEIEKINSFKILKSSVLEKRGN